MAGGNRKRSASRNALLRAVRANGVRRSLRRAPAREPADQRALRLARARAARFSERFAAQRRRARAAAGAAGLLIAEGDSWFDYGWAPDILDALRSPAHDFAVESAARAGHLIESMAYDDWQLRGFLRLIEEQARRGKIPRALLLSGGGNDIVHERRFTAWLNHAGSARPGWNAEAVNAFIFGNLRRAYLTWIAAATEFCKRLLKRAVPILIHGYGHPVPDGRRHPLSGPWLKPGFDDMGYTDRAVATELARQIIDALNDMQQELAGMAEFPHVLYVDLRPALSSASDYRDYWDNEMHPSERGFRLLAARLARAVP